MWGTVRSIAISVAVVSALTCPSLAVAATPGSGGVSAQAQVETIILASGRGFADALAGGVLCTAYDAPMMLVEPHSLPPEVSAQIRTSGATRVIILGGEGAVGPEVVTALRGIGITNIDRIAGANRFATSAAIAARAAVALQDAGDARLAEIQAVVDEAVADLQSQIATLSGRVTTVETGLTSLETTVNDAVADLESADSALSGRVDGVESDLSSLDTSFTGTAADLRGADTALSGRVNGVESGLTSLETTVNDAVADLESADSALSGRLTTVESGLSALQSVVASAVADLQSQIDALAVRVGALETGLSDLQAAFASVVDGLQSQIDDLVSRVTGVEGDVAAVESGIASIQTTVGASEAAITSLETSMAAVEGALGGGSEFWPEIELTVLEPSIYAVQQGTGYDLRITRPRLQASYDGQIIDGAIMGSMPAEALIVWEFNGVRHVSNGRDIDYESYGPEISEGPPAGEQIDFEYWFNVYGQTIHGTKTIPAGWTYVPE